MMPVIRRVTTMEEAAEVNRCDNSFTVDAELFPQMAGDQVTYSVRQVSPPYVKRYGPEEYEGDSYLNRSDRAAWLAYMENQVTGQILVHDNWNRFALIWDLRVAQSFRRRGVGKRLIAEAVVWARQRGLAGVMLETQNINVPACRLYERCGFVLAGMDTHLYRGVMPGTNEIALFWYLLF